MIDWGYPSTVDETVEKLIDRFPLKYKVYIAGLEKKDLHLVHRPLVSVINQEFGLLTGNTKLIQSCRNVSGIPNLGGEFCPYIIVEKFWEKLKQTHRLKIVKNDNE